MAAYSPFESDFKDLTAEDLVALREAAEGWYIEYKREVPNAASIAKSISAFANTYGGWLFYGVEEKSKEESVAGAFPGVPRSEVDAILQRIRQAVAGHINPAAHFDPKVIWGPCAAIGLADDYAVVCIHVPWSALAPHVHKSGQIYRRVADGSEPRPESDRFVLDQLFKRSTDIRDDYEEFVNRDQEFSKGESESPYLRLMLVADIWRDRDPWAGTTINDVRDIMSNTVGALGTMPFDTVYTTSSGFVGRQNNGNNPSHLGVTWRFSQNLVSDIIIPLSFYVPDNSHELTYNLDGYDTAERYADLLDSQGYKNPRVVDLNFVFNALIGIVEIYDRFLEKAGWSANYFAKSRLLNVWRTVPYLDIPVIIDGFEKHGTPMCLNEQVTAPTGDDPESFAEINRFKHTDDRVARVILQAIGLFAPIARAYGLPAWIDEDPESEKPPYFADLQFAGRRAMEVQRLRKLRAED